ncbi:MAG: hypothetical protein MRY77_05325 [Rhodobacteraceae bacterium]|nr:hypothetical protein [Paracoccaceae bacterium]
MGTLDGSLDQDWYRVSLQAQNSFYVEVLGKGHGSNTLPVPGIFVFDGSGNYLAQGGTGGWPVPGSNGEIEGRAGRFHFTPEQDGEYFVAVADPLQWDPGSYTVIVNTVEAERPDIPDSLAKAVEMSVAETRFAQLDDNLDTDWYRIALEAGQLYHVEMQQNVFATSQFGEESRLRIEDLDGNVLATGRPFGPDNESAGLTFRPETDGEYVAIASHGSSNSGYYSLNARALPSLQSTDGDDQLSLPGDVAVQLLDIDGGAGRDTMSFAGYEGGVVLNLANGYVRGDAPGDRFALLMDGIEAASGTSQDDRLFGSDGNDALRGLGGRDRLFGSDGRDLIHGGAGRDLLSYGLSEDGVSVSLLRGRGWSGDAAGDRIRSVENLAGSHQDDFLWGDHRANVLIGGAGDDVLTGNGGDDYLFGGAGTDIAIFAGNRADYAIAQSGNYHQITGPGGDLDQVAGVEILRFADGDLLL